MIGVIALSVLVGVVGMGALVVWVMRRYMITAYPINAPYEIVCDNIEKAISSVPGWGHPLPDWDFHSAVAKTHYFDNLRKKRIFFVCKAEYANRIVNEFPHMGAMMPCAWSVYERANGSVYLSKMNIFSYEQNVFWKRYWQHDGESWPGRASYDRRIAPSYR